MTFNNGHPALIRAATSADCTLLLELITELADYEKLAHEVTATPEIIQESLFGSTPHALAVIAEVQDKPVGYALFFHNFSTFTGRPGLYLEDIYVKNSHRGNGIGYSLMSFVAQIAVKKNCSRMEWSVLNWNKPSIDFYRSIGAEPMSEWTVQRLTGDKLKSLAEHSPN